MTSTHEMPRWLPRKTRDTRIEHEEAHHGKMLFANPLWAKFLLFSVTVGCSGWILAVTGIEIAGRTGLSEGLVGGVFTAVSTSIPELVIAVAAVRMGSLTLAVGDIIGGNAFDTLFLVLSDITYKKGSIYADISATELFWLALSILLTAILLMGMLFRERRGIGNIGLESFLVLIVYIGGVALITS